MKRTRPTIVLQQDGSLHQDQNQTLSPVHCLALSPQAQPQTTATTKTPKRRRMPNWRDGVAGAIAGAVSKTAMAPIERIKLLLQLQGSSSSSSSSTVEKLSAWEAASKIYNQEGILSFWRGNWPNVMRTAGQAALNLALMDYYKSIATSYANFDQSHPSFLQPKTNDELYWQRRRKLVISFVSGGLAGGSATTLLYPTEFLRTRLAMDLGRSKQKKGDAATSTRQYKGMSDVIVKTLKTDGIRGLYQGYGTALWGSVLYRLLFLGGYDAIKYEMEHYKRQQMQEREGRRNDHHHDTPSGAMSMTMVERFVLAQSIAITAGTICYPIDSVRRRLMMQAGIPKAERKYNGSWHCFRVVVAQEGVGGFYLGIGPNLVRSIGGALMLVAYDVIKINL